MPLDLERLLAARNVEYRDTGSGWIQIKCPFCYRGDGKFGLGWGNRGFNCFRCGKLPEYETVAALLRVDLSEARRLCREHRALEGHRKGLSAGPGATRVSKTHTLETRLPYGTGPMADRHHAYLRGRGFNPEALERDWGLLGTGNLGPFAHRIIIPIYDRDKKLICYQGRDVTGKSPTRYKSCPDALAATPIKDCVYGLDRVEGDSVVVTEGVMKVWRLGLPAVCTFGATVSDIQMLLLRRLRRVFILFDRDEAGAEGADKLSRRLAPLDAHVIVVTLGVDNPADPGDLTDADARELMTELIGR
jgi:hypothetical protein